MEIPNSIVVPVTLAFVALAWYLLKNSSQGKDGKSILFDITKAVFAIAGIVWLVVNVFLGLTGTAWDKLINNKYMLAFFTEIGLDLSELPAWFVIVLAGGLLYLAIALSSGSKKGVGGKVWDIIKNYGILLLYVGIVIPLMFYLIDKFVLQSLAEEEHIQSMLREFGLIE